MAYFADFFKALFAKLGQKNSNNYGTASNTGVPLLDMSDMSAKGSMDLNTLMSVLGEINESRYGESFDLDTFNMSGVFFLAKAKCGNAPSSVNDGIFISRIGPVRAYQIWISTALNTSSYGMFIRVKNTSWGNWYRFNLT